MPSLDSPTSHLSPARAGGPASARFDSRLSKILDHATDVFYEKGYEGASMRDLSRASGMSLAGLYHYCDSKERVALSHSEAYVFHDPSTESLREQLDRSLPIQNDAFGHSYSIISNIFWPTRKR